MMLVERDMSCPEHHDCTTTIYLVDDIEIGRRHLHSWVEERENGHVYAGHLNVGAYRGIDNSGKHLFDPNAVCLIGVDLIDQEEIANNLSDTYPWANDNRDGSKLIAGDGRKLKRAPLPAKSSNDLTAQVRSRVTGLDSLYLS